MSTKGTPTSPSLEKKPRAKRYTKMGDREWITGTEGMVLVDINNKRNWLGFVQGAGIRTRLLPGSRFMRFSRTDIVRFMENAVRVGLPEDQDVSA